MDEEKGKRIEPEVDKSIVTKSLTASGLVCDKPCWLHSVVVGESTSTYAAFTLYDNQVASGEIKLLLYVPKYYVRPVVFKYPIRFKKGLYLDFTTAGTYAFVQYRPDY